MVIRFDAAFFEWGLDDENDPAYHFVYAADASRSHYLLLQRGYPLGACDPITDEEDADVYEEDEGVYVEVDDQGFSGYEHVSSCDASPRGLRLEFARPLGSRGGVTGVDVVFPAPGQPPAGFFECLRSVFFEREAQLRMTSG